MNNLRHILLFGCLLMLISSSGCGPAQDRHVVNIEGLNSNDSLLFTRAAPGWNFEFPRDHGAHAEFQTEWWYYTGNLNTKEGRRFGFQLTFFRRGLQPPSLEALRSSVWAADQVYMAHFTITDVEAGSFKYYERLQRGAAGLAGAQAENGLKVWLLDWLVEQTADKEYRLNAAEGQMTLNLDLLDAGGVVLQGNEGYSQKGRQPGNASYYYSMPRLDAKGTLVIEGATYQLEGDIWMDHEFSTSALEEDQVGWDWFALQLDDGSELMLTILRNTDGSISEFSQGLMIRPDGSLQRLTQEDASIQILDTWTSPVSGAVYPAHWRIHVPGEDLNLEVTPLVEDQELRVSITYWEGAVSVSGERKGMKVNGYGYVELTGYAHSMQGKL